MGKDFILPDLGEGIHEAQVVKLLIQEGETVTEDQMVMEVETDKASVELPVPFAGKVTRLNVAVGDTVTVGQVLLSVDGDSADMAAPRQSAATPPQEAPPPQAAPLPEPAPTEPATGAVQLSQPASTAPASAAVAVAPVAPGGNDRRGMVLADEAPAPPVDAPDHGPGPVPAAPAVRRLARELGIDLRQVHGTGPGGRIVREDVERHQLTRTTGSTTAAASAAPATTAPATHAAQPRPAVPRPAASAVPAAPAQAPAPGRPASSPAAAEALPDFSQWGSIRREQVPQIRKTIARQMVRAWTIIPHVTHADEADVTDLEFFRKEQGKVFEQQGAKLTLTAFIIKSVAGALQQYPKLNASYDEAAAEIVFKDYVNVGIAVDTPRGLMVPVLRDVQKKNLLSISRELKDIADRARDFKLDVAEMRGGTFTITNVGALGGTMSTPMINWPEVAILGMGKILQKPVVLGDKIVPRKVLPLFMSFDHRIIDGADGARFMKAVITFLENPLNLLLVS